MANDKFIEIPTNTIDGKTTGETFCLHLDRFIFAEAQTVSAGSKIFYDKDGGADNMIIESDVSLNQIITLADATGYDHELKKLTVSKVNQSSYSTAIPMVLNQDCITKKYDLNPGTRLWYRHQKDRNIKDWIIEVQENLCEPVISS